MEKDAFALTSQDLAVLMGALGHELATPLASILLTSEVLLDPAAGQLEPHQRRRLEGLRRAVDETQRLVRRTLRWVQLASRQQEVEPAAIDLGDVVELLNIAWPGLPISAPDLPIRLWVDPVLLREVAELLASWTGARAPRLEVRLVPPGLAMLDFLWEIDRGRTDIDWPALLDLKTLGLQQMRRIHGEMVLPLVATSTLLQSGTVELVVDDDRLKLEMGLPLHASAGSKE